MYPFHHYHSTSHEVLGCVAGTAQVNGRTQDGHVLAMFDQRPRFEQRTEGDGTAYIGNGGALVNAISTATEAKCQALFEAGIPATGTASDAVSLFCPTMGDVESFAGPRSPWGARIARAVHQTVLSGARAWTP